jgi:hypothetical protein
VLGHSDLSDSTRSVTNVHCLPWSGLTIESAACAHALAVLIGKPAEQAGETAAQVQGLLQPRALVDLRTEAPAAAAADQLSLLADTELGLVPYTATQQTLF